MAYYRKKCRKHSDGLVYGITHFSEMISGKFIISDKISIGVIEYALEYLLYIFPLKVYLDLCCIHIFNLSVLAKIFINFDLNLCAVVSYIILEIT